MFENCSQPLLHDIFCIKEDDMFDNSTEYLTYACKEKDLKKNGSCFCFYWKKYTSQRICFKKQELQGMWEFFPLSLLEWAHIFQFYTMVLTS